MSLLTLAWTVAIGGLIGGAAVALEAALRHRRRPARWVWATALVLTVGAPWWGPALTEWRAAMEPGGWSLPAGVEIAAATTTPVASGPSPVQRVVDRLTRAEPALPLLWGGLAAFSLLLVGAALLRLHRRVARMPRARVGGDEVTLAGDFGPACVGLGRARIVLPRWIMALDRRALDLVLRHERSHGEARDPLLLAAGLLAVALAPWNPALWWQMVRLRKAVELDCDRRVLASGAPPAAYGRVLLAVLGRERGLMAFPAPALLESRTFLERRLSLMRSRLRIPRYRTALALALAAGFGALACETPAPTAVSPAERLETDPTVKVIAETVEIEGVGQVPGDAVIVLDGVVVRGETLSAPGFEPGEIEQVRRYEVDGRPVVEIRTVEAPSVAVVRREPEIRGSDEPLIIVDGVITNSGLADIAALDVAAIEVVKGAAAAELYGSRARGGVVSITTKGGKVPFVVEKVDPVRAPVDEVDRETLWAETDALVLLDGVVFDGGVPALKRLLDERGDEIASVEVIKGAAAVGLYGSRARNGIVEVTSKRR